MPDTTLQLLKTNQLLPSTEITRSISIQPVLKFSSMSAAVEARDGNGALGTVLASVMGADGRVNIEHLNKLIQQRLKKGAGWVYLFGKNNSLNYVLILFFILQ